MECDTSVRTTIWDEAKKLWKLQGYGDWPAGDEYAIYLAAGVLEFKNQNGRDKGAERCFVIITSTAVRCIWNIRCERAIAGKQITAEEARARWWKAINTRFELDKEITKKRHGDLAIKKEIVHHTWHRLLDKSKLPSDDWINKGTGVLVGSSPPPSGRRRRGRQNG